MLAHHAHSLDGVAINGERAQRKIDNGSLVKQRKRRSVVLRKYCRMSILLYYHVATVAEWYRYRIVACLVMSTSPVPLKTRRVGQRCMLNLSRAETASRWCGVVVKRGMSVQVSSTSLDHGSKLRGPSPKALV
ncbi:uncharacterized protein TNCV_3875821 [Trichonephila clavipes]|uniref:Uncharacterized protein n=1 Tax=Trichonephila clavipes TaxID=2585209 RepID=A0A8X6VRE6_TRICX|nr:uncharacterized protein TNCV_3875821 [Trichonephila clavipes]